jgi:hypothetical protein
MPLISVNVRVNDRKVAVTIDTVKTISEFKVVVHQLSCFDSYILSQEAIQASELNIPQERQKLIYSGRVLKSAPWQHS